MRQRLGVLLLLLPVGCLCGTLRELGALIDNEYLRSLEPDPDASANRPNRRAREVHSGHFVPVQPTLLPSPELVAASSEVCALLELDASETSTPDFLSLFSGGDVSASVPGFSTSWATPYALSIYGQEVVPNGAGSTGNGYGDGRAISVGEVAIPAAAAAESDSASRYELQLKGGGRTPFCRGADGRAVLRSSAREFLASEAMAALGVPTTRALSLIVSGSETVQRPWYANASTQISLGMHTPERHGGDMMRAERAAITTRVATSFLRVGQFELYGRRARKGDSTALRQLEQITRHAVRREYPEVLRGGSAKAANSRGAASDGVGDSEGVSLRDMVLGMARAAVDRFAFLAAEWLRVGYTQSNFNADNCLVGGATVDYGPFGFIEKYDPGWVMWIGGGQHFSFANQPEAAGRNLRMLLSSLEPLLDSDGVAQLRIIGQTYPAASRTALSRMWARKLGLDEGALETAAALWADASKLLAAHPTDWTIFWRQLSELPAAANQTDEVLMRLIEPAFYAPLQGGSTGGGHDGAMRGAWLAWLRGWLAELDKAHDGSGQYAFDGVGIGDAMRLASPKYIPREWMLARAYEAAERGDYAPLRELHALLISPYDEQPAKASTFYARAPDWAEQQGGVAFMS